MDILDFANKQGIPGFVRQVRLGLVAPRVLGDVPAVELLRGCMKALLGFALYVCSTMEGVRASASAYRGAPRKCNLFEKKTANNLLCLPLRDE